MQKGMLYMKGVDLNSKRQQVSNILSRGGYDPLVKLEKSFPDDISIVRDEPRQEMIIINCYAYALDLMNSVCYKNELARIPWGKNGTGVQSEFISYLIERKYLRESRPHIDCLVLYFDNKSPVHAARLVTSGSEHEQFVRGRWGSFGAVLTHSLWCVANNYGSRVAYYKPISMEEAERLFSEFLEERNKNIS
jgi:hypothetical protein